MERMVVSVARRAMGSVKSARKGRMRRFERLRKDMLCILAIVLQTTEVMKLM